MSYVNGAFGGNNPPGIYQHVGNYPQMGGNYPSALVSNQIRQEIQRFESVHPCIYALYEILESIVDPVLQDQIRERVICIEDSFVNSQEWTLSRAVPDIKLGIVGSVNSGKSALVHRYLTGTYLPEESPEGGRFKKEVVLDATSHLLLIRDEGGLPSLEFTQWVDGIVFVFSLEDEASFNTVYSYYTRVSHFHTQLNGGAPALPVLLVGTQDAISETNPRVIDDVRARKLASDLHKCSYYETCATYGLNVERVFQDACQKILQYRLSSLAVPPSPSFNQRLTPTHLSRPPYTSQLSFTGGRRGSDQTLPPPPVSANEKLSSRGYHSGSQSSVASSSMGGVFAAISNSSVVPMSQIKSSPSREAGGGGVSSFHHQAGGGSQQQLVNFRESRDRKTREMREQEQGKRVATQLSQEGIFHYGNRQVAVPTRNQATTGPSPGPGDLALQKSASLPDPSLSLSTFVQQNPQIVAPPPLREQAASSQSIIPQSTPILARKQKSSSKNSVQKSNSFNSSSSNRSSLQLAPTAELQAVSPFATPVLGRKNRGDAGGKGAKSGKHSDKLDEELDGRLILRDKSANSITASIVKQGFLYKKSGKPLTKDWKKKFVTLLDDGRLVYHPSYNDYQERNNSKEIGLMRTTVKIPGGRPRGSQGIMTRPTNQPITNPHSNNSHNLDSKQLPPPDVVAHVSNNIVALRSADTPNVKKKHRRARSGIKSLDISNELDADGYEFVIVSLDNKSWQFEASTNEEREEWVVAIEQQILSSLQNNFSNKSASRCSNSTSSEAAAQAIRAVSGNSVCADCGKPNPDWASMNLGIVMCIDCSGIHRNMGSHVSRVRSLDLDDWTTEVVMVMTSIGNDMAARVWEAVLPSNIKKPNQHSSREERELWIRSKYERRQFIPPLPYTDVPLAQQLMDSVARQDVHRTIHVLSHCTPTDVNSPHSANDSRTALHITASMGNVVLLQLLLWYGADARLVDHEGRTALYYAQISGSKISSQLLMACLGSA